MKYHFRKKPDYALNKIINPDVVEGINLIGFNFLKLRTNESFNESLKDKELGLIILGGECSVKIGSETYSSIGERKNVFDGKAYALYIPGNKKYRIEAESECEIALCYAPWRDKGKITLIKPKDNICNFRGKENWSREVRDIIDSRIETEHLIIGETFNPPGNWSSYPPHKHEIHNPPEECKLEEVYFFKFSKPSGFGFQKIYTDDRSIDKAFSIEENDTVIIPKGYHPVAAAPGYSLYYLWILAGEERKLIPNDDPDHKWIFEQI